MMDNKKHFMTPEWVKSVEGLSEREKAIEFHNLQVEAVNYYLEIIMKSMSPILVSDRVFVITALTMWLQIMLKSCDESEMKVSADFISTHDVEINQRYYHE